MQKQYSTKQIEGETMSDNVYKSEELCGCRVRFAQDFCYNNMVVIQKDTEGLCTADLDGVLAIMFDSPPFPGHSATWITFKEPKLFRNTLEKLGE